MRIAIMAALLCSGCATVPPAEAGAGGRCDSAGAGKLIGRMRSAEVGAQALRLTGAKALRWIAPGMAVTMDYREDRVNLHTDEGGAVVRVACG